MGGEIERDRERIEREINKGERRERARARGERERGKRERLPPLHGISVLTLHSMENLDFPYRSDLQTQVKHARSKRTGDDHGV